MKFYETKRFKELEKEWEEKLRTAGFEDIEKRIGKDRELKQNSGNAYKQASKEIREAKRSYYEIINELVMTEFAKGRTRAEIHEDLKAAGQKIEYETIRFIVRRFEHKWGIKTYTPKQMNLKKPPIQS